MSGFSPAYANLAFNLAKGNQFSSAEFLFPADKLAYSQGGWIHLDHDQGVSGSFGASYTWRQTRRSTIVIADAPFYGAAASAQNAGLP